MTEIIPHNFKDYPLAEGFYADKVVTEKNILLGKRYFSLLREARSMLESGKMSGYTLEALHRYNRIFEWIIHQYGKIPCSSKEESDKFYKAKMFELLMFEGDCWLFWNWLREKTLEESSKQIGPLQCIT